MQPKKLREQHHAEIEAKVEELSRVLKTLREELRREHTEEQHEAIENLGEYFEEAHLKVSDLRSFWNTVVEEVRQSLGFDTNDDTPSRS